MNVDELIDRWEAAWSGKEVAAFDDSCLPGVHYEDPVTSEPLEGIDDLRRHAERLWAAFPDARLEPTGDRLTNGRFVAAPVSTQVNAVANNGAHLLQPVPREHLRGVVDPETGELVGAGEAPLF